MKPNGFVAAAFTTSHTSSPRRSHISAISLTRPMLTMRNVFSSSLTISAARGELRDGAKIAGRTQAAARHQLRHFRCRDVGDIRCALIDRIDLSLIQIDADGHEPRAREFHGQWQADIPQANDTDAGRATRQPVA